MRRLTHPLWWGLLALGPAAAIAQPAEPAREAAPQSAQEAPQSAQEAPQSAQEAPQSAQEAPQSAQEAPQSAQEALEAAREAEIFGDSEAAPALSREITDREAEIFGGDEAAREAEIFGGDETAREAEIFGGDETAREAEIFGGGDADREAEIFGGAAPARTTPTAAPRREPSEGLLLADPLTIGGRLYLRHDLSLSEDTDAGDQRFDQPHLLDLYLDARPLDRLRGYARFRLGYNPSAAADGASTQLAAQDNATGQSLFQSPRQSWLIDQLWLKWDWGRVAWFTVGVQPIRWGTGRVFNPSDVVNRQRLNALTPFDFRTGMPLARLQLPIEAIGGGLEIFAEFDNMRRLGDIGAAARLQAVFSSVETSLSARARDERPLTLAIDFSAGLGPFDLYGELALSHGGQAHRWRGAFQLPSDAQIAQGDLAALGGLRLPEREDRSDAWIPQAVIGLEWPIAIGDDDALILGAEYFYNTTGYGEASIYPWLITSGDFQPFYLGRHYAAVFAVLARPGSLRDTTFMLTALANLSDRTGTARLNISHAIHRHLYLEPYLAASAGQAGGEFRFAWAMSPEQGQWLGRLSGAQGEAASFLQGGLRVPAPILQTGLWLRLAI